MPQRHRSCFVIFAILMVTATSVSALRADIYEWEWVDPNDHSQGKQQSTVLCPDGAGLTPGPSMSANSRNLTQGYLIGYDLSGSDFSRSVFFAADLTGAVLVDADFEVATLTNANLTEADLSNADFWWSTLANADLRRTNLAFANFEKANLNGVDCSESNLYHTYFERADLTGAKLRGANLFNTNFSGATLKGTNFQGATISYTDFSATTYGGFTRTQFESTASYSTGELVRIQLRSNDLTEWNFAGKNLLYADFRGARLTDANLSGARLSRSRFSDAILTNANLSGADLTNISFDNTTFTGADLTGATIAHAKFNWANDLTREQIESTASYANGDLAWIVMSGNNLTGWNFANKNLTNADFEQATLTDVNFSGATIARANFNEATSYGFTQEQFESTSSYITGDLKNIKLSNNDLTNWNFAGKDLTGVDFEDSTIAGADFSSAIGFTREQFESTDSYKQGCHYEYGFYHYYDKANLTGIGLGNLDMSGWQFFYKDLTGADFSGANITNTIFLRSILTNVSFEGTDARGAKSQLFSEVENLNNFVHPDGHIEGLDIIWTRFRVWDYDGPDMDDDGTPDKMLGITVEDGFAIDETGTLIIGLEDEEWGSTIEFEAGIDVCFDGTLEVVLRDGFMPAPGDVWRLFDFDGVVPTGEFHSFVLPDVTGCTWDTSRLMNDGVLSITAVPEPSSAMLLLIGTLAFLGVCRVVHSRST